MKLSGELTPWPDLITIPCINFPWLKQAGGREAGRQGGREWEHGERGREREAGRERQGVSGREREAAGRVIREARVQGRPTAQQLERRGPAERTTGPAVRESKHPVVM